MSRTLDTVTLDSAAQYYAGLYLMNSGSGKFSRDWVVGQFHDFDFLDEHTYLIDAVRDGLGKNARDDFDIRIGKLHKDKPREQKVFEKLLADKLAITPDGDHIEGKIGTVQVYGRRPIGMHDVEVETPESIRYRRRNGILTKENRMTHMRGFQLTWPIYAGEQEERVRAGNGVADPLPEGTPGMSVGALAFNMCASAAIAMVDALVDSIDEGTQPGYIQCRTGAQPADPDVATTGTLAASLIMTATAFGATADNADGTVTATASAISDDVSVDATVTVGYCRVSSANTTITELDPKIDGSAGVGTFDFNWNTVAFVSGATASISAYTVTLGQGSSAT